MNEGRRSRKLIKDAEKLLDQLGHTWKGLEIVITEAKVVKSRSNDLKEGRVSNVLQFRAIVKPVVLPLDEEEAI